MAGPLFDIFGDRLSRQGITINRVPSSNENIGKTFLTGSNVGPIKPNEPSKAFDIKKSFLINKGASIQTTPLKPSTPFSKGLHNVKIYSDLNKISPIRKLQEVDMFAIETEFHKPEFLCDNFHRDLFDSEPGFSVDHLVDQVEDQVPGTPEPAVAPDTAMHFDYSYEDDFFTDDFSNDSLMVKDFDPPSFY